MTNKILTEDERWTIINAFTTASECYKKEAARLRANLPLADKTTPMVRLMEQFSRQAAAVEAFTIQFEDASEIRLTA